MFCHHDTSTATEFHSTDHGVPPNSMLTVWSNTQNTPLVLVTAFAQQKLQSMLFMLNTLKLSPNTLSNASVKTTQNWPHELLLTPPNLLLPRPQLSPNSKLLF